MSALYEDLLRILSAMGFDEQLLQKRSKRSCRKGNTMYLSWDLGYKRTSIKEKKLFRQVDDDCYRIWTTSRLTDYFLLDVIFAESFHDSVHDHLEVKLVFGLPQPLDALLLLNE